MGREQVEKSIREYAQKVSKEFNPYAIYLFGSYAKGNANEDSDIDIAVFFKGFKGNVLDTTGELYYSAVGIDTRIEPHLFDIEQDDDFMYEVIKTGQNLMI